MKFTEKAKAAALFSQIIRRYKRGDVCELDVALTVTDRWTRGLITVSEANEMLKNIRGWKTYDAAKLSPKQ